MTRTEQAGFTMIEVMISVLITAIAALGFIAMYMSTTQAGSFTRHSTEASVLATDKLEGLRMGSNAAMLTASGNDTVDAQGKSGGMFTRKWTITNSTDYFDILVQVGWSEDDTTATCSTDAGCTRSGFCLPSLVCAGRAVIVRGKRGTGL